MYEYITYREGLNVLPHCNEMISFTSQTQASSETRSSIRRTGSIKKLDMLDIIHVTLGFHKNGNSYLSIENLTPIC